MGKHVDLTIDPAEVVSTSSPLEKPLVHVEDDPLRSTDEPLQHIQQVEEDPLKPVDDALAKTVMFEGTQYTFPGDATDEEMLAFMGTIPQEKPPEEGEQPAFMSEAKTIAKDEGTAKNKDGEHISYRDTSEDCGKWKTGPKKGKNKGCMTGGTGHLMTVKEQKLYPEGSVIPKALREEWFDIDMKEANDDLTSILEQKKVRIPDEQFAILINMSFNLGKKRLLKFNRMWSAVEVHDWNTVADEMKSSVWFGQVKSRGVRLVNRMRDLAPAGPPELEAKQ